MIQVLIVEDETILRKGIVSLIDWNHLGCEVAGSCENGNAALEFLKSHTVQLIVTDIKMPGLDGLELSEIVRREHPEIKIILLTAYAAFEWAKKALTIEVHSYIIKTNFIEELPEAVSSAVSDILKDRGTLALPNHDQLKNLIFSGLIDRSIADESQIRYWFDYFHLTMDHDFLMLTELLLSPDLEQEKKQKYITSFDNFYRLAFQKFDIFPVWLQDNFVLSVIHFQTEDPADALQSIIIVCNEILSTAKNFMPFNLNIAVSRRCLSVTDFYPSYTEASNRLSCCIGSNTLSLADREGDSPPQNPHLDLLELAEYAMDCLLSHQLESLNSRLDRILLDYQNTVRDLSKTKIETLQLVSAIFRRLTDHDINMKTILNMESETYRELQVCRSLNAVHSVLHNLFDAVNAMDIAPYTNQNYLVKMTDTIIHEQYQNVLKLEDIAGQLHVNSSYLSRLYKKESGDSVITALNKHRIRVAKQLLKKPEYKVSEIGQLVGIEDPAYFTNVFTKYTGMSPQKYRDSQA
ncbi:MAG: response regulator [Clostridiales bacterium]|nr:response regulator [Clostridiales bacterium]